LRLFACKIKHRTRRLSAGGGQVAVGAAPGYSASLP
jgi:hypothetical protein